MIQFGVVFLREDMGEHDCPRSPRVSGIAAGLSSLSCGKMVVVEVKDAWSLHSNKLFPFFLL